MLLKLAATLGALLTLSSCATVFPRTDLQGSPSEALSRASLIVIGVIEEQSLESTLRFRAASPDTDDSWRILRRTIRVETVLKGSNPGSRIDTYEVFGISGASGDWNSTWPGERLIFPLREDQGYFRLTGDWWRSVFPITTGPRHQLPLTSTASLGERIALMNYWVPTDPTLRVEGSNFDYNDPEGALSLWRVVKLQRGLLRHPSSDVRMVACRTLLEILGWGQDECWEALTPDERSHMRDHGAVCCVGPEIEAWRKRKHESNAQDRWDQNPDRDSRRLLTTINDRSLRETFCNLYARTYPGDTDSGCPADRPPPATIVTESGDIPLTGDWPLARNGL